MENTTTADNSSYTADDRGVRVPVTTLGPLSTTHSASSTLHVFHVDFIDTPEYHTRIEQNLQGGSIEPGHGFQPTTTTTTTTASEGGISKVSISLIIPLCTISFFMLAIGICLMCHACYRKKREHPIRTLSSSYRANIDWPDTARASMRKENRLSATAKESKLKLDKLNEIRADNAVVHNMMEDGVFSPSDSFVSYISNMRLDFPPMMESHPHYSPRYGGEVSHSFPNLILSAQAPFSPYHLTWITPNPNQTNASRSDPLSLNIPPPPGPADTHRRQSVQYSGPNHISTNPIDDSVFVPARPPMNYSSSWKSPYHPNHNTPNGSEGDSMPLPANVYVNRPATDPPPPYSSHDTPVTGSTEPTPNTSPVFTIGQERSRRGTSALSRTTSRSTPVLVDGRYATMERSAALSCPNDVGQRWRFNRVYSLPEAEEAGRAAYEDVHNLPPGHCHPQYCDVCYMGVMGESTSMCPLVGSYGASLYQQGPSNNVSYQGYFSASGSLAVHLDSCETTPYDTSTGTAQPSEQSHSGYMAEPSHSTSLGITSVNSSTHQSANHSTGVIQGLSAIRQQSSADTSTATDQPYDSLTATTISAPANLMSFHRAETLVPQHVDRSRYTAPGPIVVETDRYRRDTTHTVDQSTGDNEMEVGGEFDSSCVSKTDSSIRSVMLSPFQSQFPEDVDGSVEKKPNTPVTNNSSNSAANLTYVHNPAATIVGGDAKYGESQAGEDGEVAHLERAVPKRRSRQPVLGDKQYWV